MGTASIYDADCVAALIHSVKIVDEFVVEDFSIVGVVVFSRLDDDVVSGAGDFVADSL
jgi:hypothetical protein